MRSEHTSTLVSARPVGLALRPRLLVVRLRLRLVPGLARLGLPAAVAVVVVGAQPAAAGNRRRARSADRRRRHGRRRNRHVARQGTSSATTTISTRSRPKSSINRAARSSAPATCSSPASRSRSSPGSTAATTASATRSRPTSRPDARRQTGRRQGQADAAENHLRQARRKPVETAGRRLGARHRTPKARPSMQIKASRSGPVSPVVHSDRQAGARNRRRLPLHDHRRRLRRQRVPLQRSRARCPTSANTRRREGQAAAQHQPRRTAPCCCSCGRPTASTCRRKVLRLNGKSTVDEIGVVQKDMPNFFVEAVTVSDGTVTPKYARFSCRRKSGCSTWRSCRRPTTYKPGQKAKVKVKLTDSTASRSSARPC